MAHFMSQDRIGYFQKCTTKSKINGIVILGKTNRCISLL